MPTCTTSCRSHCNRAASARRILADIEQGRFGGFLRGGGDPGLVDLTDRLKEGGYMDKLVAARQALYTYKGKIYGIEHALTPVVLYYRADVWEGAGVDLTKVATWHGFH